MNVEVVDPGLSLWCCEIINASVSRLHNTPQPVQPAFVYTVNRLIFCLITGSLHSNNSVMLNMKRWNTIVSSFLFLLRIGARNISDATHWRKYIKMC